MGLFDAKPGASSMLGNMLGFDPMEMQKQISETIVTVVTAVQRIEAKMDTAMKQLDVLEARFVELICHANIRERDTDCGEPCEDVGEPRGDTVRAA